jgi:hypothetical protein
MFDPPEENYITGSKVNKKLKFAGGRILKSVIIETMGCMKNSNKSMMEGLNEN